MPNENPADSIKEQLKEYRELQEVADSEAFKIFFDNQMKIVAHKMIWGFGNSVNKDTKEVYDNIKDWNDFCKWRGEIIARLQPIQEIYSAQSMIDYLTEQLETLYTKNI